MIGKRITHRPAMIFGRMRRNHFEDMVNPIIHELPRLVREWARNIDIFDKSGENIEAFKKFGRRHQAAAFLTFNYTRVLEDICQSKHIQHVHGEANAG